MRGHGHSRCLETPRWSEQARGRNQGCITSLKALEPTHESAAAISVAAEAVPAEALPAADRPSRSAPRPDTISGRGRPAPAQERAAAETVPRPARKARSGAVTFLDAGATVLAVALFIVGIDTLIPKMFTAIWPWWVVLIACIGGIAVTLGAFRQ